jgi:hypothetical protein
MWAVADRPYSESADRRIGGRVRIGVGRKIKRERKRKIMGHKKVQNPLA